MGAHQTTESSESANEAATFEPGKKVVGESSWEGVARRRRHEISSAIPRNYLVSPALLNKSNQVNLVEECGILSPRELSVLRMSAVGLLKRIHSREFTSLEVATAFCKSAAVAHQAVRFSKPLLDMY